jgi:hypothetical protein
MRPWWLRAQQREKDIPWYQEAGLGYFIRQKFARCLWRPRRKAEAKGQRLLAVSAQAIRAAGFDVAQLLATRSGLRIYEKAGYQPIQPVF